MLPKTAELLALLKLTPERSNTFASVTFNNLAITKPT
jgi:hypothetical protein